MALVFSDTATLQGLVQEFEREIGANQGDISGNTTKLKQFTASCNQALRDYVRTAIRASGTWQWDDSNQTDYAILSTNLVSGQRDYAFTTDQDGAYILDVFKVFVASSTGLFNEIVPVDVSTGSQPLNAPGTVSGMLYPRNISSFTNGQNATGTPIQYDKLSNAIFLDPIPDYNYTAGLKMYVNRTASDFLYTDTSKRPGIPSLFEKYLYLKPAADYARRNSLANKNDILAEVIKMEGDEDRGIIGTIASYYSARPKDEIPRLIVSLHDNR